MCANSRPFNTSAKRFRAGLVIGKSLILQCESGRSTVSDSPTLNQWVVGSIPTALTIFSITYRIDVLGVP
jgi:hypothetical protein